MNVKWRNRYLELAKTISTWSKDPSTKIGAVIVGDKGQILSQGYNGFPRGVHDDESRLNDKELKYKYTVHGEMNAIFNASLNGICLNGAVMYVYGLPVCHECAKGIIQVGIKHVVMWVEKKISDKWSESWYQTRKMLEESGVTYDLITPD